jgi:hypothetical protein
MLPEFGTVGRMPDPSGKCGNGVDAYDKMGDIEDRRTLKRDEAAT